MGTSEGQAGRKATLGRELIWVLLFKAAGLMLIWVLFFSTPVSRATAPQATATQLLGTGSAHARNIQGAAHD